MLFGFILSCLPTKAGDKVMPLDDVTSHNLVTKEYLKIYVDKTNELTFGDIQSKAYSHKFINYFTDFPKINNTNATYWVRFTIENKAAERYSWLIEFYEFRFDTIDAYIPNKNGEYVHYKAGDALPFNTKELRHIDPEFHIPNNLESPQTVYFRLRSETELAAIHINIRTYQAFLNYALTEYYVLGIFYGLIFAMVLYNLFIFFSIRDVSYLYYVLFIASFGFYSLFRDGTGFQYYWPNLPQINNHGELIAQFFVVIFALLFAKHFLNTKNNSPIMDKAIKIAIGVRILYFLLSYTFFPNLLWHRQIDSLYFILAYLAGFVTYYNGFIAARFYIVSYTLLVCGFIILVLERFSFIPPGVISYYSFQIGGSLEMIIFSLALADKIKQIRNEQEQMKDSLNKQLEKKVKERTKDLETQKQIVMEKNKELDTFVYRASHDLKGPLKSIQALTDLGLRATKNNKGAEYFEHIGKSIYRLDDILTDMLALSRAKKGVLKRSAINFKELVEEIINQHRENGAKKVEFDINIKETGNYVADDKLVQSILQNIIENSIKYRKEDADKPKVNITITADDKSAKIKVSDNGVGIKQEYQDRLFDLFFRANDSTQGTGLGLYIVKESVSKLNGKIDIESKEGKGTTVWVTI